MPSKNGTKIDEPLQAGEGWHERIWKDVKTKSGPRKRKDLPRRQEIGKSKDNRQGSQGKSFEDFRMTSRWHVSWLEKRLWNVAK